VSRAWTFSAIMEREREREREAMASSKEEA
jgi:hypothetical protein